MKAQRDDLRNEKARLLRSLEMVLRLHCDETLPASPRASPLTRPIQKLTNRAQRARSACASSLLKLQRGTTEPS